MNTPTITIQQIILLSVVFVSLFATTLVDAQWLAPSGTATSANNAPAPINVSSTNQIKYGDITALNLKAGEAIWALKYCDKDGANCVISSDMVNSSSGTNPLSNCSLFYRIKFQNTPGPWQFIPLNGTSVTGGWSTQGSPQGYNYWTSVCGFEGGTNCGIQMKISCP